MDVENISWNSSPDDPITLYATEDMSMDVVMLTCTILQSLIIILSLIGNSLVISNVHSQATQTTFMKAKLSLALSDLGFSCASAVYVMYMWMSHLIIYQPWLDNTKLVSLCMYQFFLSASINSLAVIAFHRFYAIKEPLKHMHTSTKKQFLSIIAAWIPSFTFIVLTLFHQFGYMDFISTTAFGIVFFGVSMLIPFATLITCTTALLVVYLHDKNRSNINEIGINCRRNHRKVVIMILFMVFGYYTTCGPFLAATFIHYFQKPFNANDSTRLQVLSQTLLGLCGVVDIIAYSVFDRQFRNYVKKVLSIKKWFWKSKRSHNLTVFQP